MKKVVRTVWISLLTGLAFLVACTCQNKLTRTERKQLRQERDSIVAQASRTGDPNSNLSKDRKYQLRKKQRDYELWQRVYEIDTLLGDKRADNTKATLDSIKNEINELRGSEIGLLYGPPPVDRQLESLRKEIKTTEQRLSDIRKTLNENACVYGPPEVIRQYEEQMNELRQVEKSLESHLEELKTRMSAYEKHL